MKGFHGGFFIWDELEKIGGRKISENAKSHIFWAKTCRVYRYKLSCTGIGMQWVTCTGTGQGCTGTGCAVGNLYR